MEPMDTSEPKGAEIKDPSNCDQGVSYMPNSSNNMQTGSAPVSPQDSQHIGHLNSNSTQMQNQAFHNSQNPQMLNLPYPSGQSPQQQNQGQSSQIQNQAFQNIQNPQMQNSYPAGQNPQMQNSYLVGPNQQMQISAYPSGPNQQMQNPAYPFSPNQQMQNPPYPSGPNQQMQNPAYPSGPNIHMQNSYPSGTNQQMQNPPYPSGPNQQMQNPAYPSGPNIQMQNSYPSGTNQQMQNPPYPCGTNQQMQNPLYQSGPNQQMQNPPYPSGPNQQIQNPGYPSGPNQQMQNPPYPSGPNQQIQNPGYPCGPNQQMQNPPYQSGPNQQIQNPGYPCGPNQQMQNPPYQSGPNQQMQNPAYPSGPNQQMQNLANCNALDPQEPAASGTHSQQPALNSASSSESYQLSNQNQSWTRSTETQASSDSKRDVDALIGKVEAEKFGQELMGQGRPPTTGKLGSPGYCKKMLSCHELPVDLNEDTLSNYVEVCGDCEVKKLEFSLDQTVALVTVDNEPDWEKLTKMSKTRQLENKKIRFERLLPSRTICVLFNQADERSMQEFYANLIPRPKDKCTVERGQDIFHVITFSSPDDVEAVLRKKDQLAKEYKMLMSVYFKSIGPVQEKSELVIEAEVELTFGQSQLLFTTKKLEEMKSFVDIDMKKEGMIVMRGTPKAVSNMKVVIQDFKKQIKEKKVECSMAKKKYLLDETCGELMHLRMRRKNIEGTWYKSGQQLMICATSDGDLDGIANWIDRHLKEKIFDSSEEEFKQALKAMRHMEDGSYLLYHGNYHRELVLVAQHEEFHEACQIVDGILARERDAEEMRKQNEISRTSLQESIKETIPKDHKLFLQRFKQKDLKALETKFNVSISLQHKGPDNEVIISGQVNKEANESFKAIVRDLKMAILCLSVESSTQILSSGFLGCLEKYVGDTERCVISHKIKPLANESGDESLEGAVGGANRGHSSGHRYGHTSGHTSGHGSSNFRERGRSSSSPEHKIPKHDRRTRTFQKQIQFIVKEGEIAKEKSDIIVNTVTKYFAMEAGAISKSLLAAGGSKFEKECKDKKYKLHEGGYVVTAGGDLKCKQVFHCCLHPSTSVLAGQSFQNVMSEMLKHADSMQSKTVTFPALGTGLLGYAPESSANIMYSAVMEYSKKNENIEEVRIVIFKNDKALKAFQDVQNVRSHGSDDGKHFQRGKKSIAKVKVGEIAKEKVDVIVNTSNYNLRLDAGAVSKSLLKHAGDKLQKECDKVLKKKSIICRWEFVHTGPGDLDCKRVYHCYMPSYAGSTNDLKKMVFSILETADKHKNESIAFPALGTGNLGYPRDTVAKALFDVVKDFQKKYPSSKLNDVRFVIYPKDEKSIQAFKEAEGALSGGRIDEPRSWSPTPVAPPRTKKFKVGSLPVVVKQGDLSQESLEAVVNPMDASMSFKNNLYKALLEVGGKKFEEDTKICCDKLKRDGIASVQMKNDVMVIHVDRNKLRYGQKEAIFSCLEYADSKDYKNIGFPIMQTGDAAEGMARDMFDAIHQFNSRREKPTIIEEVYVVIHKREQFQKFSDCLKRKCDSQPAAKTESETERGQITFTITSDEQPLILRAKQVLSDFCKDSRVVGMLPIPPSISKKDITAIGLQNDKVQIKDNSKSGMKTVKIEGKPYDILKAINDFHRQFKKEFEDWVPDDSSDKFEESDFDESHHATPQYTLPQENKSWSSPSTSSHVPVKPLHHSFTEKFETSSKDKGASSINFQGNKFSDNNEEPGQFGMGVGEERADQQSATPYAMRWYYLDPEDDDLKEYDDDVSRKMEESYVKGKKEHKLPLDDTYEQFVVDFGAMEEYREKNRDDSVMVLRREVVTEVSEMFPPRFWFPMYGKQLKVQMITTAEREYENILRKIEESVGSRSVTVLKIEQIQNMKTRQRFEEKKLMLIRRGETDVEKELWFKCSKTDNIVPINHWGLSVTFTKGQHDSPLGEGIEFSQSFTDVVEKGVKENQYAYLCNVMTGKYTKGKRGLRDPPCRAADESDFYHSVVDIVAAPSKYLIFSDAQIEPVYLVTFKLQT